MPRLYRSVCVGPAPGAVLMKLENIVSKYRVSRGKDFRLKKFDPSDTASLDSKKKAAKRLRAGIERMAELQEKLYASNSWSLLLIFQAMDAAGKDSAIEHVMSGVNPQGCEVTSFKQPSSEDLDHDFLWRCVKRLPSRGRIGIFNRSYYEETLIVRVHPPILAAQRLPEELVTKQIWKERFEDIRAFERHLTRNGTVIRKFFLNISLEEQRQRFLARLDEPEKNWKFSAGDVAERKHWPDYMHAYEDMIRHTATPQAPWFVVPADHKWFARLVIAEAIIDTLEALQLKPPTVSREARDKLAASRAELLAEASAAH